MELAMFQPDDSDGSEYRPPKYNYGLSPTSSNTLLLLVFEPVLACLQDAMLAEFQNFADICLGKAMSFDDAYLMQVQKFQDIVAGKYE